MNPVACHKQCSSRLWLTLKPSNRLTFILGDPDALIVKNDGLGSQTLYYGFQQDRVQVCAMLWPSITRIPSSRLGIHQLPCAGVKKIFASCNAG
jgi:hypothetical protein